MARLIVEPLVGSPIQPRMFSTAVWSYLVGIMQGPGGHERCPRETH